MQAPATQDRPARPGQTPSLGDFIVAYPGALTAEVCETIIAMFERDPHQRVSTTSAGVVEGGRTGMQVDMARRPEWAELKDIVTAKAIECLHDYARRFAAIEFILTADESFLSPPVIERFNPGQGFSWHIDSGPFGTAPRFLTSLTYLNDVENGGATEFPLQVAALQPSQGTIVLFPPYWLYPHRAAPPTDKAKYKITAHFMVPEQPQRHL